MSRLAAYQAVEVDLFSSGSVVAGASRNADIIQARDLMVRAFVTPGAGFSPRELSARLFVKNGADIEVFFQKKVVSAASTQGDLASTFVLEVPAASVGPTTEYRMELVECGDVTDGLVGAVRVPTAPDTTVPLEARKTGVIKVTFVPITHVGRTPNTSEPTMEAFAKTVEDLYPTEDVEWTVTPPMSSGQGGGLSWETLLNSVTKKRATDDAADDVYYYGIVDPAASYQQYCGGGCILGLGWIPELGGWGSVENRAAIGIGFGTEGAWTFSHELGHNQGRPHAPCGGAAGPDPGFPYSGGAIGSWGYNRGTGVLISPQTTDFMGYCQPTWISDYNFQNIANRIAAVNGLSIAQPQDLNAPLTKWLRMLVTSEGATWSGASEGRGQPTNSPEPGFIYDEGGDVIAQVSVHRIEMSHSPGYVLYVPQPEPTWFAVGVPGGPTLIY